MRGILWRCLALVCAVFNAADASAQAANDRPLYIIVDSSGSMAAEYGANTTRMAEAQRVVAGILADNQGRQFALKAFGHEQERRCESVETLAPIGSSSAQVQTAMRSLVPSGSTPIAASLEQALIELDGRAADIILVTDGIDSCNRDVCALIRDWRARGVNTTVEVRSVGMSAETADHWSCLFETAARPYELSAQPSNAFNVRLTVLLSTGVALLLLGFYFGITTCRRAWHSIRGEEPQQPIWLYGVLTGVSLAGVVGAYALVLRLYSGDEAMRHLVALLNSEFVSAFIPAALIALIGYQYKQEVDQQRASAQLNASVARSVAVQDDRYGDEVAELAAARVGAPSDAVGNFSRASALIKKTKEWISARVSQLDGRRRRKYENLSGYDYREHVDLLERDGRARDPAGLSTEQANRLMEGLTIWRPYSTGRVVVPDAVVSRLTELLRPLVSEN